MVSEEEEHAILLDNGGKYILAFDPLDGSSNIDCNVSIGTIFGIWKKSDQDLSTGTNNEKMALRAGNDLVASGYCCYGSACQLVLCTNQEVNGYT